MNEARIPRRPEARRLLTAELRERFRGWRPDYGRDFTDAQWEEITDRLEALARLLWRISCRSTERRGAPAEARERNPGIPESPPA
jgi:hypothetical protein